jgi:pimeloyl-ACP methyl ester carboxylesterase
MAQSALAKVKSINERVIPIGLSMGGMVALEIWRSSRERVAAMALFDTDAGPDTLSRRRNRDAQIVAATQGEFANVITEQLKPAYFSPSPRISHQARTTALAMATEQGIGAFASQITALATRSDATPLLATIDVPVLVGCGSDDRICLPASHRYMAAQIPLATFIEIANAGHLPPLEQPGATTETLRCWLLGLDSNFHQSSSCFAC